ncbi:cupin domain-containing protein [Pseudomonas sp. CM25]|uniref:cupin domain-containing protein n=1 Tax=unclassified Pseudomonas TaxID=196821 RepID=UPI001556572B|nr:MULTISPECIES: cupin domain-containing protein [unclassified Pseudomonas]NQD58818.1 cupin domain-containing protein [Pseudomonas sp. CM25]NQD76389.1 cupin domain-containing protein [Pseudomonas sp. CM27]HEN8800761.1 cupin domain-containing protein [Pseudomonas putida]
MKPVALILFGLLAAQAPVWAHGDVASQVKLLQQQQPSNAPGKNAIMLTVSYAPGEASPAHQHPGAVMAYVLEGAVISKLNGEPEKTYKAGDYWYEAPGTVHSVSRNASDTQPAKLLVWSLVEEGSEVTLPYPASGAAH